MRDTSRLAITAHGRGRITWGRRIQASAAVLLAACGVAGTAPLQSLARSAGPSQSVSVIVRGGNGSAGTIAASVAALGGTVDQRLDIIDGVAARIPARALGTLAASPGIREISPNAAVRLLTTAYTPATEVGSAYSTTLMSGAQTMWQAGFTGAGVDIALIDSGVSPVAGLSAPGKIINGPDLSFDSPAAGLRYLDGFGHGTFMAGLIAGRDTTALAGHYAGDSASFLGVAPDARVLSVKVADAHGNTDVSQVIAAIAWVVQHRFDQGMNVRVLNLSFGTDSSQVYWQDPLAFAIERAWGSGIVVVTSAGNRGWKSGGLTDPAYDPYVIAAGAVNPNGSLLSAAHSLATFSSLGDGIRNPDLVAPGTSVQSLRVPGSFVDQTFAASGQIDQRFFRGSGTSEAAAVVSGAVALLLQEHPLATPDAIKALLSSTASPLAGQPVTGQGSGEMNLVAASTSPLPLTVYAYTPSNGRGTLEGSRGSVHVSMNGVTLTGERDIFGAGVDTSQLASQEMSGAAWQGGTFNGNSWSGNSWSGNSWSGNSWSGNSWSGNSWSGNSWSGNSWSGNSWSGNSWSGNSWSGNSWSGNSWSGNSWSGNSWSTAAWS